MAYKDEKCNISRIYDVVIRFFSSSSYLDIFRRYANFSDRPICVYEYRLRMIKND